MAVGDAHVFPGFCTPVLTQLFFQNHRPPLSHASVEVKGENTPERKFALTGDRTHNHQVISPTRSPVRGRKHLKKNTHTHNNIRRTSSDEKAKRRTSSGVN